MGLNNSDRVVEEYAASAQDYDQKWAFYIDATTRETIKRLPITATDRVLDVGCGTGELLRRLAEMYPEASLAGADPVREMLDVAKSKLSPNADLQLGWANQLPWPDHRFDVVVSCNVFHYMTHPAEALTEMAAYCAQAVPW
jgi:ubiquinone/menaquinone biosynthesis C-methylase UbiE